MLAAALVGVIVLGMYAIAGLLRIERARPQMETLVFGPDYVPRSVAQSIAPPEASSVPALRRKSITLNKTPIQFRRSAQIARRAVGSVTRPELEYSEGRATERHRLSASHRPASRRASTPTLQIESARPERGTARAIERPGLSTPDSRTAVPAMTVRPDSPPILEPIVEVDQLMHWIELNYAPLPPGVQRHVEARPSSLTATALMTHEGHKWELYLMVRPSLRELHVVVVRSEQTYYLIDRSFQREGLKFRTGRAQRQDGVIVGVISEEQAAASTEAVEIYNAFLKWWDANRKPE